MNAKVEICSPPHRENLVVSVMIDGREFCEINRDNGKVNWEFYPNRDNLPWCIDHNTVINMLKGVQDKLDKLVPIDELGTETSSMNDLLKD